MTPEIKATVDDLVGKIGGKEALTKAYNTLLTDCKCMFCNKAIGNVDSVRFLHQNGTTPQNIWLHRGCYEMLVQISMLKWIVLQTEGGGNGDPKPFIQDMGIMFWPWDTPEFLAAKEKIKARKNDPAASAQ